LQNGGEGKFNSIDAKVFLCVLYRGRALQPRLRFSTIVRLSTELSAAFEQAQMYAPSGRRQGDRDDAICRRVEKKRRAGSSSCAGANYYQIGNIQFWYRDYNDAADLKKATAGGGRSISTREYCLDALGSDLRSHEPARLAMEAYRKAIDSRRRQSGERVRRYLSSPYRRESDHPTQQIRHGAHGSS